MNERTDIEMDADKRIENGHIAEQFIRNTDVAEDAIGNSMKLLRHLQQDENTFIGYDSYL